METISRLARRFSLARSTLLYYDRIGLLKPSARSRANYRLYTKADRRKLEKICAYRRTGMALIEIRTILASDRKGTAMALLEKQLAALDAQIETLRRQQQVILQLMGSGRFPHSGGRLDRDKWVALLRATGMGDDEMMQWHIQFERLYPDDHRAFLVSLGMPGHEVAQIRKASRQG
jgi:DNA-binding transcriptional MerR regulator